MEQRCPWCGTDPLYVTYHDREWGRPCADDRVLFEFLLLESAQAGLNWLTILRKREHYRQAFADFDPARVADFGARERNRLLVDSGIVRNRLKIESAIGNAAVFLELQARHGSFARYLWDFVGATPVQNRWSRLQEVPTQPPLAVALSKALKAAGMRFVGPTICYAYMQAAGLVNDHLLSCPQHAQCAAEAKHFRIS